MLAISAVLLVIYATGDTTNPPQITYTGLDSNLWAHDFARDQSAPFLRGTADLPVAWSWSPDGHQLAYVLLSQTRGNYRIELWTPELRQRTLLVAGLPVGAPPQWSPDGQTIAAINPNQDICLYAVSGGDITCLGVSPASQPSWSPDGESIAYISLNPRGGLMRVGIEHRRIVPLFTGVNGVVQPRWSPDGNHIAFVYQPGTYTTRQVYYLPAGGGEPRALTDAIPWQDQPVWSPDSQRIAFIMRGETGDTDIASYALDTGTVTQITTHPNIDTDPRWSPDGRYLAFVSTRTTLNGRPHLYIIPTTDFDHAEPLIQAGIPMLLYAFAWRP